MRAGVQLVDVHGLEALSMRRLGAALGVEAMSLYRYVTNKSDLLDGIHGAILEEMVLTPSSGPWVERVRGLAHAFRQVLRAHPRALPLFATRPAVADASLAPLEAVLVALQESGLGPEDQLHAVHGLASFVIGNAFWQFGGEEADEPDYPAQAERYPHLSRLGVMETDPEQEFQFGLDALLDGIAKRARATRRSAKKR